MKISEIVIELSSMEGEFPARAVEEARRRSDEMTPHLLDALTDDDWKDSVHSGDPFLHVYALFLLAEFREPRAFPAFIDFFSIDDRQDLDFPDVLGANYIPRLLASVAHGRLHLLRDLIENEDVDKSIRGDALVCCNLMVETGQIDAWEVRQYFQELFLRRLPEEPSYVWDKLVQECTFLKGPEFEHLIREAFSAGLVDTHFISLDEVLDAFETPPPPGMEILPRSDSPMIANAASEMADWPYFRVKQARWNSIDHYPEERQPVREPDHDADWEAYFERADDLESHSPERAAIALMQGWRILARQLKPHMTLLRSVEFFDGRHLGDSILDWISIMRKAGKVNQELAEEGHTFCKQLLEQFTEESEPMVEMLRAFMGAFLFWAGRPQEGERIIRDLISDLPENAFGYGILAWCLGDYRYSWNGDRYLDVPAAIALLEDALSRPLYDPENIYLEHTLRELRERE